MKKASLVALALAMLVALPTVANAETHVWFALAGDPGVEGAPLILEKPAEPGRYEFNIDVWVGGTDHIGGWSMDLITADPRVSVKSASYEHLFDPGQGQFDTTFDLSDPIIVGPAPLLVNNIGQLSTQSFSQGLPPSAQPSMLWHFLLSIIKEPGEPVGDIEIFPATGGGLWATHFTVGGQSIDVSYAGGTPTPNQSGAVSDVPGIIIQQVPEPATMALLGLGLMGLIRRRR